jgi:preprotein translocase subunit SecE
MSVQRRPVSRRSGAGPSAPPRGRSVVGEIDEPIDEPIDEMIPEGEPELTAAEIRAQRAEERRYRPDEQTQQSVLGERLGGVRRIFFDTKAEVKKITWPDRETTRNLTAVVIAISVVLGIVLGGIDWILFQIFEALP